MSHLVGTNVVQKDETSVCEGPDLGTLMYLHLTSLAETHKVFTPLQPHANPQMKEERQ